MKVKGRCQSSPGRLIQHPPNPNSAKGDTCPDPRPDIEAAPGLRPTGQDLRPFLIQRLTLPPSRLPLEAASRHLGTPLGSGGVPQKCISEDKMKKPGAKPSAVCP